MGGRNQEMALAALGEFKGDPRFLFLSAGTDGIDGHSDAAGALVDSGSWERAEQAGLKIDDYLARNDSYRFFRATGDLLMTGPTGTNVMDVTALLITGR
jgi:hydroxypyruvate reductase/glycerate 2-kinase